MLQISSLFCDFCSVSIAFSAASNSADGFMEELPLKYLVHVCNVCWFWISIWYILQKSTL